MRIVSVKLDGQYKGLKDQTFDFSCIDSNIQAFIGLNGAGKSQLLELIAEVFAFVERYQRPYFSNKSGLSFGVEIDYKIKVLNSAPSQSLLRIKVDRANNPRGYIFEEGVGWLELAGEIPVPDYVVGYSSGLNSNLQNGFLKNMVQFYDVQRVKLKRKKELLGKKINEKQYDEINSKYLTRYPNLFLKNSYAGVEEVTTNISSLFYLDYDSARLMISALSLLPRDELQQVFRESKFKYPSRIVFNYNLTNDMAEDDAVRVVKMLKRVAGDDGYRGLGKRSTDEQFDLFELDYLSGRITLNLDDSDVRSRLANDNYNEPLTLFKRLFTVLQYGVKGWQSTDVKNLRNDAFLGNIKKPLKTKLPIMLKDLWLSDGRYSSVRYDDMSDGEAQLIEILGMARLFNSHNTLFLMDEPETHLNPAWRTYFHTHLSKALKPEFEQNTQVLLSTHSPFMISSLRKNNVFMFERGEYDRIEMMPIGEQTYGTTFEILIKRHFGLKSTISQSAVAEVKQHLDSDKLVDFETDRREWTKAREWIEVNLGESMEKAYLLRKLQS